MEIIMKEIDVLSTFYENADLDDSAQANIYLEAGGNGKISEAINKIGEKIKDIIRKGTISRGATLLINRILLTT